jgi:hypothetical protein
MENGLGGPTRFQCRGGHEWGTELPPEQKLALIDYLKGL